MSAAFETEFAIVGGGVVGLGVGWELARRGREVILFERETAGSGASTAAAGMLAPTAELQFGETELLEFGLASLDRYPRFVERLEERTSMDVDYRTGGTLVVGIDRDDTAALDHVHSLHRRLGLDAERLTGDQARELEPSLTPSVHSAVHCRSDHQVDPRRLMEALVRAFEAEGGELCEGTEVDRVDIENRTVHGLYTTDGARCRAETVLVAAGAWVGDIDGIPEELRPRVRPLRGQMLAVDLGDPPLCGRPVRAPDPSREDVYLVPKSDGRLLVGATCEERGFDPHLTAGGVFELLRGAYEAVPAIYDQDILEMWTGFRPATLDNNPILGPTDIDGLWFAVGHGRDGILLAPITAELLAEALTTGRVSETLAHFTPAAHSG